MANPDPEITPEDVKAVRDDAIVRVTDLALTARIERGGYRVWVTSITDGAPLEGVAVEGLKAHGTAGALLEGVELHEYFEGLLGQ